ncbi:MAG: hypothetical protein JST48_02035 [Bacteroidetes bacterium]|nr:hypothetical protein [Bacteroidota bacterium]
MKIKKITQLTLALVIISFAINYTKLKANSNIQQPTDSVAYWKKKAQENLLRATQKEQELTHQKMATEQMMQRAQQAEKSSEESRRMVEGLRQQLEQCRQQQKK